MAPAPDDLYQRPKERSRDDVGHHVDLADGGAHFLYGVLGLASHHHVGSQLAHLVELVLAGDSCHAGTPPFSQLNQSGPDAA